MLKPLPMLMVLSLSGCVMMSHADRPSGWPAPVDNGALCDLLPGLYRNTGVSSQAGAQPTSTSRLFGKATEATHVRLRMHDQRTLSFVAEQEGRPVAERRVDVDCSKAFVPFGPERAERLVNEGGAFGYTRDSYRLQPARNGDVTVRSANFTTGIMLLIPVAGSESDWALFTREQE
ncbi:MAG: hypothetical protein E6Q88_12485 [Lysobacteraceae bacterium]|nr:MAG: hypothetical protein E6Q88_12485 [Xanthomonadaceae bacterium]